jgi:hypothetical protein
MLLALLVPNVPLLRKMTPTYPFPIFIGYDPKEAVAYHVLEHSLRKHSTIPLAITPLSRNNLLPVFTRERLDNESTEFSFSSFLVPYLCGYHGWALFMDCDMLVRADIAELAALCNPIGAWYKSVYVVKHDYKTITKEKFLGAENEPYPRKNWSSVMLFNNTRCRRLTPDAVNEATGPYLHRFQWTTDDQIGDLPVEWNHLVDEYAPNAAAKNLHFTLGGPYFPQYDHYEGSDEWWSNFMEMIHAQTSGLSGTGAEIRAMSNNTAGRNFKFDPGKIASAG